MACAIIVFKTQSETRSFAQTLKIATFITVSLTLVAFLYFAFAVYIADKTNLVLSSILMGLSAYPVMFLGYELVVSLTPGIGEAMSCGLLNTFANAFGFFVILLATNFLSKGMQSDSITVLIILAVLVAVSLILIALVNTKQH